MRSDRSTSVTDPSDNLSQILKPSRGSASRARIILLLPGTSRLIAVGPRQEFHEKRGDDDGGSEHSRIVLKPLNPARLDFHNLTGRFDWTVDGPNLSRTASGGEDKRVTWREFRGYHSVDKLNRMLLDPADRRKAGPQLSTSMSRCHSDPLGTILKTCINQAMKRSEASLLPRK